MISCLCSAHYAATLLTLLLFRWEFTGQFNCSCDSLSKSGGYCSCKGAGFCQWWRNLNQWMTKARSPVLFQAVGGPWNIQAYMTSTSLASRNCKILKLLHNLVCVRHMAVIVVDNCSARLKQLHVHGYYIGKDCSHLYFLLTFLLTCSGVVRQGMLLGYR